LPGDDAPTLFPLVDASNVKAMRRALADADVTVSNVEFFPVTDAMPIEAYRAGFAIAGEIGAKRAVTHVHDPVDSRAVDSLGRLCDLASEHGLTLGLEVMGLSPACATLERGSWFVRQVGRPNIGLGVDALHVFRTGGSARTVASLPAGEWTYAQICDAGSLIVTPDYLDEALERMIPGDGVFPLADFLRSIPGDVPLDVEVPSTRRIQSGRSALDHSRAAVEATRSLLATISAP
jgi:sugar phosphate isomerase/epimerase